MHRFAGREDTRSKTQPIAKTLPEFALRECTKTSKRDDKKRTVDEEGLDLLQSRFAPRRGGMPDSSILYARTYNPTKQTDPATPQSRSVERDHSELHDWR
jgi:hypothetical protein